MATKKTSVEPKRYPMTQDEMDAGYYQAQSELNRAQIRKDEAAQDKIDAQKRKAASATPPVIPSEAQEVIRQKAKDAAYESGEAARKKSMGTPFAKGGVTRADGCITKGRTKGRFV